MLANATFQKQRASTFARAHIAVALALTLIGFSAANGQVARHINDSKPCSREKHGSLTKHFLYNNSAQYLLKLFLESSKTGRIQPCQVTCERQRAAVQSAIEPVKESVTLQNRYQGSPLESLPTHELLLSSADSPANQTAIETELKRRFRAARSDFISQVDRVSDRDTGFVADSPWFFIELLTEPGIHTKRLVETITKVFHNARCERFTLKTKSHREVWRSAQLLFNFLLYLDHSNVHKPNAVLQKSFRILASWSNSIQSDLPLRERERLSLKLSTLAEPLACWLFLQDQFVASQFAQQRVFKALVTSLRSSRQFMVRRGLTCLGRLQCKPFELNELVRVFPTLSPDHRQSIGQIIIDAKLEDKSVIRKLLRVKNTRIVIEGLLLCSHCDVNLRDMLPRLLRHSSVEVRALANRLYCQEFAELNYVDSFLNRSLGSGSVGATKIAIGLLLNKRIASLYSSRKRLRERRLVQFWSTLKSQIPMDARAIQLGISVFSNFNSIPAMAARDITVHPAYVTNRGVFQAFKGLLDRLALAEARRQKQRKQALRLAKQCIDKVIPTALLAFNKLSYDPEVGIHGLASLLSCEDSELVSVGLSALRTRLLRAETTPLNSPDIALARDYLPELIRLQKHRDHSIQRQSAELVKLLTSERQREALPENSSKEP